MTNTELHISYREIVRFVDILKIIYKKLQSDSFTDCSSVLNLFEYAPVNYTVDSGFESEETQVAKYTSSKYLPSSTIKELIFESNNIDSVLENGLITICQYIDQLQENFEENNVKIEAVLTFLVDFVDFLSHMNNNVPFMDIISMFLDAMFAAAMTQYEDTQFNFVMNIFLRLSELEILQNIILTIIIKYLKIFTDNLKVEEVNEELKFFHYESDLSRINSLFLTQFIMKSRNSCESSQHIEEDICSILENFVGHDDFFNLMILGHHTFLTYLNTR